MVVVPQGMSRRVGRRRGLRGSGSRFGQCQVPAPWCTGVSACSLGVCWGGGGWGVALGAVCQVAAPQCTLVGCVSVCLSLPWLTSGPGQEAEGPSPRSTVARGGWSPKGKRSSHRPSAGGRTRAATPLMARGRDSQGGAGDGALARGRVSRGVGRTGPLSIPATLGMGGGGPAVATSSPPPPPLPPAASPPTSNDPCGPCGPSSPITSCRSSAAPSTHSHPSPSSSPTTPSSPSFSCCGWCWCWC
ncbi:hypothetical protein E2C01_071128 [Portunus trituberculatus]|uniref:Uncharacterized protein n=1 Tax=Portunus trituberculatus TaxID=210409 RepID=A0A5B7I370_PORTR|nr:hypothetical protein [Portunus trituberculatus]